MAIGQQHPPGWSRDKMTKTHTKGKKKSKSFANKKARRVRIEKED